MKIALSVHLSKQKMDNKIVKDVKQYYGNFNGTIM